MTTICAICGSTALCKRDQQLLCEDHYRSRVPSWGRRATDRIDGHSNEPSELDRRDLAQTMRAWQLLRAAKPLGFGLLFTIMFSVVAVLAALSSEWGDFAISAPIALVLALGSLRLWRRFKAPPGRGK